MRTNIRPVRESRGMGIRELSNKTGINRGLLSQIERGIYHPDIEQCHKIAEVLGEPVSLVVEIQPRGE